jgi:membrane-bound lytic murein transglycosylase B
MWSRRPQRQEHPADPAEVEGRTGPADWAGVLDATERAAAAGRADDPPAGGAPADEAPAGRAEIDVEVDVEVGAGVGADPAALDAGSDGGAGIDGLDIERIRASLAAMSWAGGATPAGEEPARRDARTRLRRRGAGVMLAVAAALAGSITTSRTMLDGTADGEPAADTSELGGSLPFQEDDYAEADVELAAFEDPELLEDVPVSEEEVSDEVEDVLEGTEVVEALGESGIPEVAIEAYQDGADVQADADPECGIRWTLLAAIGRVESNHGRFGGARLKEDGYGTKPIRGIPLDGRPNVALIRDTDGGELDGDTTFDRAVGPMQFIPSTWRSVGQDGNDDGRSDPNNMFDAAQGAGAYLCAGGGSLDSTANRAKAIRRYNNADSYVQMVLRLATMYETGRVEPLPDLPATPPPAETPSAPRPPAPTPTTAPTRPRPTTPAPSTPPTTAAPGPRPTTPAPTTTVPPTPTTTIPDQPDQPGTTVPGTTPPPVDPTVPSPSTTVPPGPPTPADPPAAVGWAPAMREVVVDILTPDCDPAGGEGVVPADEGTDSVSADEATTPDEAPCEPAGAGDPAAAGARPAAAPDAPEATEPAGAGGGDPPPAEG